MFELLFTTQAEKDLHCLEKDPNLKKRLKAVKKCLGYLQSNPRHPSLNTHKFQGLSKHYNQEIFEAYAENHTAGAYRIFWHYGVGKDIITIIGIVIMSLPTP